MGPPLSLPRVDRDSVPWSMVDKVYFTILPVDGPTAYVARVCDGRCGREDGLCVCDRDKRARGDNLNQETLLLTCNDCAGGFSSAG